LQRRDHVADHHRIPCLRRGCAERGGQRLGRGAAAAAADQQLQVPRRGDEGAVEVAVRDGGSRGARTGVDPQVEAARIRAAERFFDLPGNGGRGDYAYWEVVG
jgi:hypothetical protein